MNKEKRRLRQLQEELQELKKELTTAPSEDIHSLNQLIHLTKESIKYIKYYMD